MNKFSALLYTKCVQYLRVLELLDLILGEWSFIDILDHYYYY